MKFIQKIKELDAFFDEPEGIVKPLLWVSMVVSFYFNLNSLIYFAEWFTKLPYEISAVLGIFLTFLLVRGINTFTKGFIKEFGVLTVRFYTLSALIILLAIFLLFNSYNGGAVLAENKVKFTPLSEASAEAIKNQIQEETNKYNLLIQREDSLLSTLKNNWLTAKQREQILQNKATYIKEKSQRLNALEAQYASEIAYIRAENVSREKQFKSQLQKANEQGGATGGVSELAVFILTAILIGLGVREKQNASPTLSETEVDENVNLHENLHDLQGASVKVNHTPKFEDLNNKEFIQTYGQLFPLFKKLKNNETNLYQIKKQTALHQQTIDKLYKNWIQRDLHIEDEMKLNYEKGSGKLNGFVWTNPNTNSYHHDTT